MLSDQGSLETTVLNYLKLLCTSKTNRKQNIN